MREEPPAAFTRRPPEGAKRPGDPSPEGRPAEHRPYDPLPLCIYTTIGVISWLITPPLTVAIFGGLGVAGYVRARRRGLARSRCKLGDTRLVIAYLAVAAVAGAAVTLYRIAGLFS